MLSRRRLRCYQFKMDLSSSAAALLAGNIPVQIRHFPLRGGEELLQLVLKGGVAADGNFRKHTRRMAKPCAGFSAPVDKKKPPDRRLKEMGYWKASSMMVPRTAPIVNGRLCGISALFVELEFFVNFYYFLWQIRQNYAILSTTGGNLSSPLSRKERVL